MNRLLGLAAVVAVMVGAGTARAEVLPVSGIYPAQTDAALGIETIAVDSFGGDRGASLEFAITDALASVSIEGRPWFALVPEGEGGSDAVLRGVANVEAFEQRVDDKVRKYCAEKDAKGKCIRRKVAYIRCDELSVAFYPDARLIASDGREIFAIDTPLTASQRFCEDESSVPSIEGLTRPLIAEIAQRFRLALAPVEREETFRVLERRKGLDGDQRDRFKHALKLTKHDVLAACEELRALEESAPDHPSVLFNVGLCAESEDDLEAATSYYQAVASNRHGRANAEGGLMRIRARGRADRQLERHRSLLEAESLSSDGDTGLSGAARE